MQKTSLDAAAARLAHTGATGRVHAVTISQSGDVFAHQARSGDEAVINVDAVLFELKHVRRDPNLPDCTGIFFKADSITEYSYA